MNSKTKTGIFALAFVLVLVGAYFAYQTLSAQYKPQIPVPAVSNSSKSESVSGASSATGNSSSSVSIPKTAAPDFTVYDSAGKPVKLSDFKGKPIVLNFWASWCSPCKKEMPDFNEVYAKEKDNVQFLMVNMTDGQEETQQTASEYVKSNGFSFPIYFDLKQQADQVYGVSGIPTTMCIDKDGYILMTFEGAIDKNALIKIINQMK
jgi:thiol-disulfide isomerase/thioredoxin